MSSPLISIIVPIYNAEKKISKLIETVQMQTYQNWELNIVNDGSTDHTKDVILQHLLKDNRIRYFEQGNAGPSAARNRGIEVSNGKYLTFLDADDWIAENYLEKLIIPMETIDTDIVCAGYFEINKKFPQGVQLHDFDVTKYNKNISRTEFQTNLFTGLSGVLWAKLFKKEYFKNYRIKQNVNLRLSEDLITVLEYSTYIKNAFIVSDSIYYYNRSDENSLSGKLKISNYEQLQLFFQEVETYRNQIEFINLDLVLNERKNSFLIKLLNDASNNRQSFYQAANFVVSNESTLSCFSNNSDFFTKWMVRFIYRGNFFSAWTVLLIKNFLRNIKNG